jgi:lysophospholipase L1-like esterase
MKKVTTILAVVVFNLFLISLLVEAGFRIWIHYTTEDADVFEQKVSIARQSSQKQEIPGKASLGQLVQKSSHPGRVYEFKPNIKANYIAADFETNSFGIRSAEHPLEKPENTKRIIGLGDSVMFGWGVSANQTYLALTEAGLNESKNPDNNIYETLNFAVPGYNTSMEVDTYEQLARRFSPDLVVIHFVENDLGIPLFMSVPQDLFTLKKSYALESIKSFYRALRKKNNSDKNLVGVEFTGVETAEKNRVLDQYRYMVGNGGFSDAMKKLASLTCKDRVPVIILAVKLKGQIKRLVEKNAKKYGFHIVEVYQVVDSYIEKNGLENTPKARKKLLWLNNTDPHPNALGHQLYAEALLPRVEEILAESSKSSLPNCPN